jgi:hypothetical protein
MPTSIEQAQQYVKPSALALGLAGVCACGKHPITRVVRRRGHVQQAACVVCADTMAIFVKGVSVQPTMDAPDVVVDLRVFIDGVRDNLLLRYGLTLENIDKRMLLIWFTRGVSPFGLAAYIAESISMHAEPLLAAGRNGKLGISKR